MKIQLAKAQTYTPDADDTAIILDEDLTAYWNPTHHSVRIVDNDSLFILETRSQVRDRDHADTVIAGLY